ncbi:MAG: hypothetical protein O2985_12375 [Proteobacteria bacterium]|nr:hypothetical protein [Pseudomonadota bacterium]
MDRTRNIAWAVTLVLLLSATATMAIPAHAAGKSSIKGVAKVIDAGTLQVGDKVIKLYGIIAPSARQKCRQGSLPWLCGAAARTHLVDLAQGKNVQCLKVGDYYARCFVRGLDLSKSLVANGWAVPDKAGAVYRDAEAAARRGKLGMWKYAK